MAVRYSLVREMPLDIKKDEMVIKFPDFMDEIKSLQKQLGVKKSLTARFIRQVFMEIAINLDEAFDPMRDINPSIYDGAAFNSLEDISKVIVDIAHSQCPLIIEKTIEKKIQTRPMRIKHIYFVANDYTYSGIFNKNGIDNDMSYNSSSKSKKTQSDNN